MSVRHSFTPLDEHLHLRVLQGHFGTLKLIRKGSAQDSLFVFSLSEVPKVSFQVSGLSEINATLFAIKERPGESVEIGVPADVLARTRGEKTADPIPVQSLRTRNAEYLVDKSALGSDYTSRKVAVFFLLASLACLGVLFVRLKRVSGEGLDPLWKSFIQLPGVWLSVSGLWTGLVFAVIFPEGFKSMGGLIGLLIAVLLPVYFHRQKPSLEWYQDELARIEKGALDASLRHDEVRGRAAQIGKNEAKAGARFMEAVRMLLSRGTSLNTLSPSGESPLILLIKNQAGDAAGFILTKGADPNFLDSCGVSPLHHSIQSQCPQVLIKLLDAGADPLAVHPSTGLSVLEAFEQSSWGPQSGAVYEALKKAVSTRQSVLAAKAADELSQDVNESK